MRNRLSLNWGWRRVPLLHDSANQVGCKS
jgi:hypothetical protein